MAADIPAIAPVLTWLRTLQDRITAALEQVDGTGRFRSDLWTRTEGGGGESRVLRDGTVFEQAGVNFSHVVGAQLPGSRHGTTPRARRRGIRGDGRIARDPPAQPVRADLARQRALPRARRATDQPVAWWFGGGFDLTPYYPFDEDVLHWHRTARAACDPFGADVYAKYKDWCDRYFFLKHRNETRGVGGLFFDDLNEWGFDAHVRVRAQRRRALPGRIPADRRATQGHALRRARALVPAVPARTLRRVQPRLRPRHAVRPADAAAAPSRS